MDRPVENQTPILGYVVFRKHFGTLASNRIYASPGIAIAAIGATNWQLSRNGLVPKNASPKEFKAARALNFSKSYDVRAVYAGESV